MRRLLLFMSIFVLASCNARNEPTPTRANDVETVTASDSLLESLKQAIKDKDAAKTITVSLMVSGGPPSEVYRFSLTLSGQGTAHYDYMDRLAGEQERTGTTALEEAVLVALLDKIIVSGVLDITEMPSGFLPDTMVGQLEISDGRAGFKTLFVADREQAVAQGKVPTPALDEVVEALYALGANIIGVQSVKP